jgi:hypothetical protein
MPELQSMFETEKKDKPEMLDKEAFAAKMKQEREELFTMRAEMTEKVLTDPKALNEHLTLQSRLGKMPLMNTLLIQAQRPDAALVKTYDGWMEEGHVVKRGAKSIKIIEQNGEYTRDDGSVGTSYRTKKVFDVSDTRGGDVKSAREYSTDKKVQALTEKSDLNFRLSENVSPEQTARYNPETGIIQIAADDSAGYEKLFYALARETAMAKFQLDNPAANQFASECVAKIVCERMNVKTQHSITIPDQVKALPAEGKNLLLSCIRRTSNEMIDRVKQNLYTRAKMDEYERAKLNARVEGQSETPEQKPGNAAAKPAAKHKAAAR